MSEDNQHVVDPNTADIETLTQTPGIGPVLAERIIAARPYKTLEDLQWVNGISTTLLGQLRPYLTLPSAQKVEEGGVAPAEGITAEAEPETAPEACHRLQDPRLKKRSLFLQVRPSLRRRRPLWKKRQPLRKWGRRPSNRRQGSLRRSQPHLRKLSHLRLSVLPFQQANRKWSPKPRPF